jgi:hypothetical protein
MGYKTFWLLRTADYPDVFAASKKNVGPAIYPYLAQASSTGRNFDGR